MSQRLRIDGVVAGYGPAPVLRDLTLDAAPGGLTALVGPSGCGKTTALAVVAGLLPPDRGEVWIGDQRVTTVPAERRGLAMVFQKPLLFPHMTVAENVAFGLEMRGVPVAARRQPVAEALRLVQMDGYERRRPRELSGGQEQRVALARALVTRPRVLLLDEPLSALDASLRRDMRALIRSIQRALGITTVLVTHDQDEAADMADCIALMLEGAMAQVGTPHDLYTTPRTADVAAFFGWVVRPDGRAFHPQHARLCPAPSSADHAWPVTVERTVEFGAWTRVTVRLDDGATVDVREPPDVPPFAIGASATLHVRPDTLRRFLPFSSIASRSAS